mmetsp:Transcript_44452/g.71257  ORF Transcript_44452/g.71257 Transcript_44452/m.71257 type:complete len:617 (+) Transcript_44452:337-2187(+)
MSLSCHVLVWAENTSRVSLTCFKLLSTLSFARSKVGRKSEKRGWPGHCQPFLVFAYPEHAEACLEQQQDAVISLLQAFSIVSGSPTASGVFKAKPNCCSYWTLNEDSCHLRETISDAVSSTTVDTFSVPEWIAAAGVVATTLTLTSNTGLIAALNAPNKPTEKKQPKNQKYGMTRLESVLQLEEQLVKSLCEEGMPKALQVYTQRLPPQYNSVVHAAHLELAVTELRKYSGFKGSLARTHEKKLADQCKRIWRGTSTLAPSKSGVVMQSSNNRGTDRRLCDAISLSGNPCMLLYRACTTTRSRGPPVLDLAKCSSGVTYSIACSCGKTITNLPDFFQASDANDAKCDCCAENPSFNLSGEGSIDDIAFSTPEQVLTASEPLTSPAEPPTQPEGVEKSPTNAKSPTSAGLRSPGGRNTKPKAGRRKQKTGGAWMLHKLGDASFYDPSVGLKFENFTQGYNRLEPWVGMSIHIGLEYECMDTGSRQFFAVASLASPNQPNRTHSPNTWPEFDVDLFLASETNTIAQLQRIYVRIPPLEEDSGFVLHAQIAFDNVEHEFCHKRARLPSDSFVCLCLPRVYMDPNDPTIRLTQTGPVLGQRFRSIAVLKAGVISCVDKNT